MRKESRSHIELQRAMGRTIGEVSRAWRYEMNLRLKPFGLNLSMRQVLVQLHRHPEGLMQRELARKLGIEGPTLVRLLDELERKQWVRRMPAQDDKRRKYAVLTAKANDQIRIIERLSQEMREEMMKGLSSADIALGLDVMARIRDNLETLQSPPDSGKARKKKEKTQERELLEQQPE